MKNDDLLFSGYLGQRETGENAIHIAFPIAPRRWGNF